MGPVIRTFFLFTRFAPRRKLRFEARAESLVRLCIWFPFFVVYIAFGYEWEQLHQVQVLFPHPRKNNDATRRRPAPYRA